MFSVIWQAGSALFGVLVFAGIIAWLAKAHSHLWRKVSDSHPRRLSSPAIARKAPDTILITRRGESGPLATGNAEYRQYAGAKIAVHAGNLTISLLPPFNLLCPPIELPFDEMEMERTNWALWPEPYAIRMRHLDDIDMIVGHDTGRWLRDYLDSPPFASVD